MTQHQPAQADDVLLAPCNQYQYQYQYHVTGISTPVPRGRLTS